MSQPTASSETDAEADAGVATALGRRLRRPSTATAAGAAALVPLAAATGLAVLRNAPVALPPWVRAATPLVEALAAVVPALALVAVGAGSDRLGTRLSLVTAGAFPLVATAGDAAWVPAAAALTVGGASAVALRLRDSWSNPLALLAALAFAGLAASLLGSAGVATVALRSLGATLAFAALASLPVLRPLEVPGLAVWVVAAVAVGWLITSAPFVAGAVTLVAFGAGDVPFALLALGLGGAVAVALAGLARRRWNEAVGALLLLVGGAPATLPRATAVVLALVVLVGGETDA